MYTPAQISSFLTRNVFPRGEVFFFSTSLFNVIPRFFKLGDAFEVDRVWFASGGLQSNYASPNRQGANEMMRVRKTQREQNVEEEKRLLQLLCGDVIVRRRRQTLGTKRYIATPTRIY